MVCGSNWKKKHFNRDCGACMMHIGMTFAEDEIETRKEELHRYWQESTVTKLNEIYATEAKLKAAEDRVKTAEAKQKAAEAKLEAAYALWPSWKPP